ncbi:hypothetical protein BOS5A_130085 [Bosea sp. EC-HK365B]|nr:hypothetical protein BOSE7B_30152 [Bosea sp. 7B]VVT55979.1 hypothetical protein BOS5A_130085 [Bosea sp. EC-HK365B]
MRDQPLALHGGPHPSALRAATFSPEGRRKTRESNPRVAPHRDRIAKSDRFPLQPPHALDAACTISGHAACCRPWLQLRKGRAE